jgi:hypothetical protein
MWAQQYFTLVLVKLQAHGLRSAASHYLAWDLQVSDPQAAFDALNHPSAELGAIPTDSLAYSYMTSGMSNWLGEESSPSHALLERHVVWIDKHLNSLYAMTLTPGARTEIARVATANLIAWFGWLRAMELFSLTWADLTVLEPLDGPILVLLWALELCWHSSCLRLSPARPLLLML